MYWHKSLTMLIWPLSNLANTPWQLGFQTPSSPIAEGIFLFHDDLRVILINILVFVMYILYICIKKYAKDLNINKNIRIFSNNLTHFAELEIIWTIRPALVLGIIAIPSFALLYSIDEIIEPLRTIKVIGHQWYWSYEYFNPIGLIDYYNNDLTSIEFGDLLLTETTFDSYLQDHDTFRLLSVDRVLKLPTQRHIRVVITSADVLHSWAIPALGVKLDSCPGRLNQTSFFINYPGIYFGQCSEICGLNHGFRPIRIQALSFRGLDEIVKTALSNEAFIISVLSIKQE